MRLPHYGSAPWVLDLTIQGAGSSWLAKGIIAVARLTLESGTKSLRFLSQVPGLQSAEDQLMKLALAWKGFKSVRWPLTQAIRILRKFLAKHLRMQLQVARLQPALTYAQLRLHEALFDPRRHWNDFIDSTLWRVLRPVVVEGGSFSAHPVCKRCMAWQYHDAHADILQIVQEPTPGVFIFPVFTQTFCELLLAEVDHFYSSGLPFARPNSMNNYGVILDELGLGPVISAFQRQVLQPLARVLFPGVGSELDSHHAFIVHYSLDGDKELTPHRDDSDITFNVALGRRWSGSNLSFCGLMQEADVHVHRISHAFNIGSAVLHLGRHVHGAEPIVQGERVNLIVWNRNSAWRAGQGDALAGNAQDLLPADSRCLPGRKI